MNNKNQTNTQNNNIQNNNVQNNSFSALDALNAKLSMEPVKNPPANAKQSTLPKNVKSITKQKNTKNIVNKKNTVNKKNMSKTVKSNNTPNKNVLKKTIVKSKTKDNLTELDIDNLDEEIKKLKNEIKNKEKIENKIFKNNVNDNSSNTEVVNSEEKNTFSEKDKNETKEKEIKESRMALIKLLIDAKKNKDSNEPSPKESISNNDYQESFDIEDYDPDKLNNNEEGIMEVDFNDPESQKLIKVIEDEDMNYSIPPNVKIRSSNPNNSFAISRNNVNNFVSGSIYFDVESDKVTTYDCYNDYMVDLNKRIKLKDINIKSIDLPKNLGENINNNNCELKIVINNKEQIFELEENYYNRYEIKDFLNEAFKAYDFDISCDINDGIFQFHSQSKFTMLNSDTSILPILGFNKNAYVNKNMYVAENSHQVGDNVYYLVLENISSEPLFYINKDTDEIKKLFDFEPFETDNLIIKFNKSPKDSIKNNKEYNYFFSDKHSITFELII